MVVGAALGGRPGQPHRVALTLKEVVMSDHKEGFEAPGTFVIALVFLAVFVVVYVVNFKLLSNIWEIR